MIILLLLFCCSPSPKKEDETSTVVDETDTDTDTDSDTDTDTDSDTDLCEATVLSLTPAEGTKDAALSSVIVASFSEPVDTATVTLEPAVSGKTVLDGTGLTATFTPDASLLPDSDYLATAQVCGQSSVSHFHTAAGVGVDLTGRIYRMDLTQNDITWTKPSGLGPLLLSYIVTKDLLFLVEDHSGGMVDMVGVAAINQNGTLNQYVCTRPIDFDPVSFSNDPSFTVGPATAQIQMSGAVIDTYNAMVSGTFELNGSGINDAVVTMLIDARDVYSSFGFDVCGLLSCVTCPDGAESCVELEVQDAYSPEVTDVSVDPNADPANYTCN